MLTAQAGTPFRAVSHPRSGPRVESPALDPKTVDPAHAPPSPLIADVGAVRAAAPR